MVADVTSSVIHCLACEQGPKPAHVCCSSVLPEEPTCAQAVILKIFLDRVAFTPVNMTALFVFTGLLEGLSWRRSGPAHVSAC